MRFDVRPHLERLASGFESNANKLENSPHRNESDDGYTHAIAEFRRLAAATRVLLEGDDTCDMLSYSISKPENLASAA
jgi:predicted phosphoadenosine phosphosulfate sulfurtransferase